MTEVSGGGKDKFEVLDALAELYPWMRPFYRRPVREYACHLYNHERQSGNCEVRARSFDKLMAMFTRAGLRGGRPPEEMTAVCADFASTPVLQTGPHLLLACDPEAFYSHLFSLLGLTAHRIRSYVSYSVSTVNLVEKGRKGPGWLNVDDEAISLFGLSRTQMLPYSLLAGPGRYRFEIERDRSASEALASLRRILPQQEFERPSHALKAANRSLLPELFGQHFNFLQIDDEDVADLVEDHLSDENSWLRQRLFEQRSIAPPILEEIDKLALGSWAGWLTRGTDFFWLYENGRRLPLRLVDGQLVNPANGAKAAGFRAAEVRMHLAERRLIPNLLLVFLVVAILPGVRVLGGSRHPIYYPLMRYAVARALQSAELDAELRRQFIEDRLPGAWGHRVIEHSDDPINYLTRASGPMASSLADRIGAADLERSCGSLSGFVSDPLWQEFSRRLANKNVGPRDAEWSFA